jgi:subtilisin-like proprotein convertase family protein
MYRVLTLLAAMIAYTSLFSQQAPDCWTEVSLDAVALPESAEREFEPYDYHAYTLDYDALLTQLSRAPLEYSPEARANACQVLLPRADGTLEVFSLSNSPVMPQALAARWPMIQTFTGHSLKDPSVKVKCSFSPEWGFKALIRRGDKGIEYVERLAKGQNQYYMVYDRLNFPNELRMNLKRDVQWPPGYEPTPRQERFALPEPTAADRGGSGSLNPVNLKIYRFACATTGEFSQDHGGTTASVLAAMVNYTNQLNAIYEGDLDIRLILVDSVEKILFLDPNTDPYTGVTVYDWLGQNPLAMITHLGAADKYDIGHVFARYITGDAIGVAGGLCCTQFKGRGCSAGNLPYGDYFFSVVGQEIGHQWSGGHTWNRCGDNAQFSYDSACEPGSGSTIMSYAGACGSDNVQNSADLYYQICSVFEIRNFVENGTGSTCGSEQPTGNNAPVVTIPLQDNFFIPISTPFELNGSAVDPDGDSMTYNWAEVDLGPQTPLGTAVANSPLFRSFPPGNATNRVFPRLQSIITNTSSVTELLPTYSRDLTFCLVARDNRPGGGGVGVDTVAFRSTSLAGPFQVISPNSTSVTWKQGEYQVVTWDVANTDKAPVNCQTVNIRLSKNTGFEYPYTLASGVPNTGQACVLVPTDVVASAARIRVEAADNIFFDISNANFKIQVQTAAGFSLCAPELAAQICLPQQYTVPVSTSAWMGYDTLIALSASGLPAGATASFTPAEVQPGQDAVMTITFPEGLQEGVYNVAITGNAGTTTASVTTTLTVVSNNFNSFALQQPADGADGVVQTPVLRWSPSTDANAYEVQIGTSPSFAPATLKASNANVSVDTFRVPVVLDKGKVYYWRVRPKNECGNGAWSEPFVFSTLVESCNVFVANDLPKIISANGTPTIESVITVNGGGVLSDVNIRAIQGSHDFFKDLDMRLIGPDGTQVLLFKDKCPQSVNYLFGFDDAAELPFGCPPPNTGTPYKPTELLSVFNGKDAVGAWKLRVKDNVISSGGILSGFELELCSSTALNAPYLVNNNVLSLASGTNAAITSALLLAEDADNTPAQLTYTLITVPQFGRREINWTGAMAPGAQFTQADLNNGAIRYFEYGYNTGTDGFRFAVTDGNGGFITSTFMIAPVVGINDPTLLPAFNLSPNPAHDQVRLQFTQPLRSDVRLALYAADGRQLRSWTMAAGATDMRLNVEGLPQGIYSLMVESAEGVFSRKVVIR